MGWRKNLLLIINSSVNRKNTKICIIYNNDIKDNLNSLYLKINGDIKLNRILAMFGILLGTIVINLTSITYAADIKAGEQIFSANCSACHSGGNNAIMPEKTLKKDILAINQMNSVDAISNQVTNGKNAMPAFGGRLTDEELTNVASYVLNQAEQGW